jgi:hypothetical protein
VEDKMNFPIPPTDNLYKFAALLGTIIVFASLYFPHVLLIELGEKIDAATLKIGTTEAETAFLERKAATLSSILESTVAPRKGISEFGGKTIALEYSDSELKGMLAQFDELKRSTAISLAEANHYNERSKALSKEWNQIAWFSYGSAIVGLILAFIGFSLWYTKIQIYQDKALKHSANEPNEAA